MALLLGTVLTAHIIILNAYAQGPPPGAPASQLAALTDRWSKWILSIDTTREPNPFATTYQGDCSQLIQGKTMFLVGQTGAGGTVDHGTCDVPSGTRILFPVVNFVNADCTDRQERGKPVFVTGPFEGHSICFATLQNPAHGQPFANFRQLPNEFINGVSNLKVTLDGVPLEFVRVQSPPGGFGVRVAEHNAFFGELGPTGAGLEPFGTVSLHAIVDGYWTLLQNLPPGEHELVFSADTPPFGGAPAGSQTNSYTLVVQ